MRGLNLLERALARRPPVASSVAVRPQPVTAGDLPALDLDREDQVVEDQHEVELGRQLVLVVREVQRVQRSPAERAAAAKASKTRRSEVVIAVRPEFCRHHPQ